MFSTVLGIVSGSLYSLLSALNSLFEFLSLFLFSDTNLAIGLFKTGTVFVYSSTSPIHMSASPVHMSASPMFPLLCVCAVYPPLFHQPACES